MAVNKKIGIGIAGVFFIAWIITLFQSVSGTYIAQNNKNTIDTLILYKDGSYYRALYIKLNSKLVFSNKGKWNVEDNSLILSEYYHDEDEKYERNTLNFTNVLSNISFPIEHSFGRIVFDYQKGNDSYRYYRLWWQ
jgi:hypothetical protein